MLDSNDLLNLIKKAASEAVDASKPAAILYGKVLNTSPLEINVEQKMILHKAQLVLTRNVSDYETEVTVDWSTENKVMDANHSHSTSGEITVNSTATISPNPDNESVTITNQVNDGKTVDNEDINLTHNHAIKGRKKIIIHNGLKVNDEVLLIRMQGGQKYIILDKVV